MSPKAASRKTHLARFARVPESVFLDKRLTRNDLLVYSAIAAHCFRTNLYQFGQRRLSLYLSLSRRSIRRSLEKLARSGHISTAISKLGGRSVYQLNSPVFLVTDERFTPQSGRYTAPTTGRPTAPTTIQ